MDPIPGAKRLGARVLLAEAPSPGDSLIETWLEESGCAVDVAGDGVVALSRLIEGRYNVALVHLQLPGVDGYEVMLRFRQWERVNGWTRTPIVALTAQMQEDIDPVIKAGADAQLTKPFLRDSLLDAVELYQRSDGATDLRVDVPVFMQELAPEFLRRQRSGLLAVCSAFRAGEFDPIRSFAHNMKGCGKSFGFPRLTDLGRELEYAAKDRDGESVRRRIHDVRKYLTEVDIA